MSLRKKIIFAFFISALIITILAAFEYLNFIQVRNEMSFLEVSDTIRSKSLQLRRYEKNFFLFPDKAAQESQATKDYLNQLNDIALSLNSGDPQKISALRGLVSEYRTEFSNIETLISQISVQLDALKPDFDARGVFPMMKSDSRDKPLQVADFLQIALGMPPQSPEIANLQRLDAEIIKLRDTGENILTASKDLDTDARDSADNGIRLSQIAILVFFPLFLGLGLATLFYIGTGLVKRLKTLTDSVDQIGQRYAHEVPHPQKTGGGKDEVDILIDKFNHMNSLLMEWEIELNEKNQELLQSKKLAAIGTLAAGVAHELNNPLNNISLSAQVLQKSLKGNEPATVRGIVDDIVGQTARVKGIVGNLLEFAREREPSMETISLETVINNAYQQVSKTMNMGEIDFGIDTETDDLKVFADPNQMERVFINLFSNAVSAMEGRGRLAVRIEKEGDSLYIYVSDTGKGLSPEDREKVFDPFFTKKEKGTGLGLAIVLNIIRKHGGNIAVVSEENMGTVFEIILPRKAA